MIPERPRPNTTTINTQPGGRLGSLLILAIVAAIVALTMALPQQAAAPDLQAQPAQRVCQTQPWLPWPHNAMVTCRPIEPEAIE